MESEASPHVGAGRLHAFDALRGAMMLLGVVLHGLMPYATIGEWHFHDAPLSGGASLIILVIHAFRMPVFFVTAGFFAALIVSRRGRNAMLRNRLRRVTLVGAVFWLVLQPLLLASASWAYGRVAGETSDAPPPVRWSIDRPMHLWFLWYLTWYCVLAWIILRAIDRRDAMRTQVTRLFARYMRGALAPLIAAVLMIPLLVRQGGTVITPSSFALHPWVFLTYGAFFLFGWLLWSQRSDIASLHRGAGVRTTASLLSMAIAVVIASTLEAHGTRQVMVLAIGSSLSAWLAVFGFIGLASRYASQQRAIVQYFAGASYWIYLIHLPVIVALGGLIAPAPLGPIAKAAMVIVATTVVTAGTYALFVRSTFIGRFMTGR